MKAYKLISTTALLFLIATGTLWSFSFEPISRSFSPEGRGATQSFRLKNEGDEYIAVRLSMFTREIDIDGQELREQADHLFTIYPERVVLKPRTNQTVRIKWEGPTKLSEEKCYRILVEQLPVDFDSEGQTGSGLKIMFRYLGAIYITPEEAQPEVVLYSSKILTDEDGKPAAEIVFHNRGTRHAILSDLNLTITGEENGDHNSISFAPEDLEGLNGENILPGAKRRLRIPLPDDFHGEKVSVEFIYDHDDS